MSERHDIILRQHEDGPNPPDLLQQIVEDIKKLVPETGEAARKYVKAKGEQELAKVQEIKARVYEKIGQLEIERQRLIQQREEAEHKAEQELQTQKDKHEESLRELEIQSFKERTKALREVVECIVKLKERGIQVDMEVIQKVEKTAVHLLEEDISQR